MIFGQLILKKILNMLQRNVSFFQFRLGCAPDPAGVADSVPPDLLVGMDSRVGRRRAEKWKEENG